VYSSIWATSKVFGRPPGSTIIRSLFATPDDACLTSVVAAAGHEAADASGVGGSDGDRSATAVVRGGAYLARGLFARGGITRATWEPAAGAISCLDWPMRSVTGGALAARVAAVDIAPKVRAHATTYSDDFLSFKSRLLMAC
jgi:hypothetical protein